VTVIFILTEALLIMLVIYYSGGLGVAYTGTVLCGFLFISGTFHTSGGIASSAKRVSIMANIGYEEN